MIRFVGFLLFVLALAGLFAWFADRPGDVVLSWQGMRYETSLLVAVAALLVCVGAILLFWWIVASILRSPQLMRRYFRNRRRDRGYHALSQGLVAAGAGDAAAARRLVGSARGLLGGEPLVELLDAQTLLLEGDGDRARQRFEAMLEDDDTRLLGLRGLHRQAEAQGNLEAAYHYAGEAAKTSPGLAWAGQAMLRHLGAEGNWEGALERLETLRTHGAIDKGEAARKRAVLLTAQAHAESSRDPAAAAKLAQQAIKLAPDLVPAATVGAEALARLGEVRKARRLIEASWKRRSHPELAGTYVHLEPGETVAERLKHAEHLAKLQPDDAESRLAVAEAAAASRQFAQAREQLAPLLADMPTRRACLLASALEEAETGDAGKVRDWLARAMRAPADPAWVADGVVSQRWLPVSPVSGRLDAFEWKVPPALIGAAEGADIRIDAGQVDSVIDAEPGEVAQASGDRIVEDAAQPGSSDGAGDSAAPAKIPRQPDDPGTEPEPEPQKGFRLF
jgi:HemY protein